MSDLATERRAYPLPPLPHGWEALAPATAEPSFRHLRAFLEEEAQRYTIYPAAHQVFRALELTPLKEVRVLLLGQDPYHRSGQAEGLAFSVPDGTRIPPSLRNIFCELESDLGISAPMHGSLMPWAQQGVLLLNAVLTVREGEPASHAKQGWERFTDTIIRTLSDGSNPVVFALWGGYAQKKLPLIDQTRHPVVTAAHPSPLSARRGFLGTRPFSRINAALAEVGRGTIEWGRP